LDGWYEKVRLTVLVPQQSHCILDVNLSAVERLHRNKIYPIVLLLKFKSAKQIKEIKDSGYGTTTMVRMNLGFSEGEFSVFLSVLHEASEGDVRARLEARVRVPAVHFW
jgi:hypothetical protein